MVKEDRCPSDVGTLVCSYALKTFNIYYDIPRIHIIDLGCSEQVMCPKQSRNRRNEKRVVNIRSGGSSQQREPGHQQLRSASNLSDITGNNAHDFDP